MSSSMPGDVRMGADAHACLAELLSAGWISMDQFAKLGRSVQYSSTG